MYLAPSKKISTFIIIVIFFASWVKPVWPHEQALHTSLTLVGFVSLWIFNKKTNPTCSNYFLIALFLCVHSIAARWLYSYVPYDMWLESSIGFSFKTNFGWSRNNFDRLVHFLYGFCLTPVLTEYFKSKYQITQKQLFLIALSLIMVSSLVYEWFEWFVALVLSPQNAEAYNGQQGDMWDAHKDMLLATVGSLIWASKLKNEKSA